MATTMITTGVGTIVASTGIIIVTVAVAVTVTVTATATVAVTATAATTSPSLSTCKTTVATTTDSTYRSK